MSQRKIQNLSKRSVHESSIFNRKPNKFVICERACGWRRSQIDIWAIKRIFIEKAKRRRKHGEKCLIWKIWSGISEQKLNLIFSLTIENEVFPTFSLRLLLQSDMFYYYLLSVYYAAGFYLFLSPSLRCWPEMTFNWFHIYKLCLFNNNFAMHNGFGFKASDYCWNIYAFLSSPLD